MFKKILIALVVILVALVVVIALQPSEFRVTRTAVIAARPGTVFAQVNDFHKWPAWSPWEKLDPALKRTYDGPEAGEGATYAWVGNSDVGEGKMTIVESKPDELIKIKLEFIKPFAATNTTVFEFVPEGEKTKVTWDMSGENNFMGKAMCLVMDMDKMVGGSFDEGLAQLKTVSEAEEKPAEAEAKPAEEEPKPAEAETKPADVEAKPAETKP